MVLNDDKRLCQSSTLISKMSKKGLVVEMITFISSRTCSSRMMSSARLALVSRSVGFVLSCLVNINALCVLLTYTYLRAC